MRKISYVVPCYGSEKSIEIVVKAIKDVMNEGQDEYEIILVNDSSPDNVWHIIHNLAESDLHIIGIDLTKNFGQHSALMAGYGYASGDIVISMDDDGQTPVESVYSLIEELDKGYDVVFARYETIKQNKFRIFGSYLNEKMTERLVGKPKNIKATSFFAMKVFVVKKMLEYNSAYPYIGGLIFRTTQNIGNVLVKQHTRLYGTSGYRLTKLIRMWVNGFTAFSVKPLRLATFLGFFSSFVGIAYGIYIVIHKLLVPNIAIGYSSIMAIILFIGGIIMMLLGLIGEYVGRIYICINRSPQYVIRQVIGRETDGSK